MRILSATCKELVFTGSLPVKCCRRDRLSERAGCCESLAALLAVGSEAVLYFLVSSVGRGMNGKDNNPGLSLLFERHVVLLATGSFSMWTGTSCCAYCIPQNTAHSVIVSKWDFPSNKCPLFKQIIFYAEVKHCEIFLVWVMLVTLESHQASMLKKENVNGKFWNILPFWFLRESYRFSPLWSLIMTDVCGAEFTYIIVSNRDRERIFITAGGGREKTWCWTRRQEQSSAFFAGEEG